ncbi:hypothetical protein C0584_06275 [Candidatus Parcubacteria bacterium]|nr:MAG: hypothetical protein C0584_06275 [Candidatus Parcubacteria bacterium]
MKMSISKLSLENYGVPLLIILLPTYLVRFEIFGIPFTLLEISFFGVFLFWLVKKYNNKGFSKQYFSKRLKYPFSLAIVFFVLSSFIGLAVNGFSNAALGIYKAYFIEAVLFYVLVFNFYKKVKNRERLHRSLAVVALWVSLWALVQKIFGIYWSGGENELRVTGPFTYPNALGLFLGPISVFLYFYFINLVKDGCPIFIKDKFYNLFIAITFFLSVSAIYYARSEAALGAVLLAIFFGSIFLSKRFAVVFISLGVLASIVILTNQNLKTFTFEKIQLKDFSGEVRKQQWRETGEMLKNDLNFISGCGLSGYQDCISSYHQEGIFFNAERDPDFRRKIVIFDDKYKAQHWRPVEIYLYPHNIFLNFWTELGIVGLFSFFFLVIQYIYFGIKLLKKKNHIIIIGFLAVLLEIFIHGMVDVPYFKNDLAFLWWLLFALMGVYWVEQRLEDSK